MSEWYYNYDDHRWPARRLAESLTLSAPAAGERQEVRTVALCVRLLGSHHDGYIEFRYPSVFRYEFQLDPGAAGHRDWRTTSFVSPKKATYYMRSSGGGQRQWDAGSSRRPTSNSPGNQMNRTPKQAVRAGRMKRLCPIRAPSAGAQRRSVRRRRRMVAAGAPECFVGYWRITEMELWDADYLDLVVPALSRV
jgi:hypothetical protein